MATTLVYYGLVTLTGTISFAPGSGETRACVDGHLHLPEADLIGILISSCGEIPAIPLAIGLVTLVGRKSAVAATAVAIAVVMIPLMASVAGAGVIACLFLSRMSVAAAFNVLWLMTPEYCEFFLSVGLFFLCGVSRFSHPLLTPPPTHKK